MAQFGYRSATAWLGGESQMGDMASRWGREEWGDQTLRTHVIDLFIKIRIEYISGLTI